MKADEVRLYALRGGLKKQAVCYTHFHSNKVFRGDLMILLLPTKLPAKGNIAGTLMFLGLVFLI